MPIDFKLLFCILLNLVSIVKCFNSDVAYANLILKSQSSNQKNLYFTKAGIYSVRKSNASKLNKAGSLIYLVEQNSTRICSSDIVSEFDQSVNIALVEVKDQELIETQIRSFSCFAAAILISNDESNEFKFDQTLSSVFILMVSNSTGKKILEYLIRSSENISIIITSEDSARELSPTSLAFIIVGSFVVIVIICSMWALFYKIQNHRRIEDRELLAIIMLKLTKKAISKMKSKKLKEDDQEYSSGEICTICLESYQPMESIRILPCLHYFHKNEIDTWLFENQTCPICKIDVLKAYGLDIKTSSGFIRRQLERLNLLQSPLELSETILAQADSRRGTLINSRRSTIYSATLPSVLNDSSVYQTRRDSLFFGERFSDFGITIDRLDDDAKPRTTRKLTFFGENLEMFKKDNRHQAQQSQLDHDSNRSKANLIDSESTLTNNNNNTDPINQSAIVDLENTDSRNASLHEEIVQAKQQTNEEKIEIPL